MRRRPVVYLSVVCLFLSAFCCVTLRAAERTWDGTGRTSDWSDIGNWVGNIAPQSGDSLRFSTSTDLTIVNDYAANTDFSLITFAYAGYNVTGNAIDLSGGLAVTHASGSTIFSLPITLLANQTFSVQPGATLFLNGDIQLAARNLIFDVNGQVVVVGDIDNSRLGLTGQLRKQGTGLLWMFQPASYNAPTLVNDGIFRVDGRVTNTFITISSTGTLRGAGRVGSFRAVTGGTVQPGFNNTDLLTAFGNVEMSAGSTFAVRLHGTAAGSTYDQLDVRGTVTLGGTLNVTVGFTPAVGDIFTIIENDGEDEVIGTFVGLPEGAEFMINGRPFRISYGGQRLGGIIRRDNDVTIEAVPALAIWDGGGTNDNRWSQPLNWVGDTVPWDGDDLLFAKTNFSSLVTRNDLPPSRFFSSMFFGLGSHQLQGDALEIRGRIETTDRTSVDLRAPITLRGGILHNYSGNVMVRGLLTLSANQTFSITDSDASLSLSTNLALSGHQLTLKTEVLTSIQTLDGPGSLLKTGLGTVRLSGASSAQTTVAAGIFQLNGVSYGPIVVKTGAVLVAEGSFYDLDVEAGGFFEPGIGPTAHGTVRLREGSTFHVVIADHSLPSGTIVTNTGFTSTNATVLLENADLRVTVADIFPLGRNFPIVRLDGSSQLSGTFRDMPEGSLAMTDDGAFAISYTISYANDIRLTADPEILWDGGGAGGNWSTVQNWMPDFAPTERMDLKFPAVTKRSVTNDLPVGTSFGSLTFTADSYSVYGNAIRLINSIGATITSNQVNVYADITTAHFGNNGFGIGVNGSATLNLEGALTGNDQLWKFGSGTLRLAGTKNNSEDHLWVRSGRLELAKVNAIAISKSLRLGFPDAAVVTYFEDNQISDFAAVTVGGEAGGSRLDLNGYSDTISSLSGSGIVDFTGRIFGRQSVLSVARGNFDGNFVGNGTFVIVASPPGFAQNFILGGDNTFSGDTFINGGELRVEGNFLNSPLRLNGGTLSGRGHVSTITANVGGILSPGSGGMALNVALHSGNVALNPATTFRTLLTSATIGLESHKLNVTGTVNLGGSTLKIDLFSGFRPGPGFRFVIIENDGTDPIVGTFNGLPEGGSTIADGLAFTVSYVGGDANDVELTRTRLPPSVLNPIVLVTPEHVTIRGEGYDGGRYYIERTADLTPPILWQSAGFTTASNGVFELINFHGFLDPDPPRFFYRAVSP
jgi:autotransporter-associated beta strand protein